MLQSDKTKCWWRASVSVGGPGGPWGLHFRTGKVCVARTQQLRPGVSSVKECLRLAKRAGQRCGKVRCGRAAGTRWPQQHRCATAGPGAGSRCGSTYNKFPSRRQRANGPCLGLHSRGQEMMITKVRLLVPKLGVGQPSRELPGLAVPLLAFGASILCV